MPEFESRDPRTPGFWDERFERGFTPWDMGGVPRQLREFAERTSPQPVLIPGCGAAYELVFLCEAGWDATAIDFSPAAVATARAQVGRWGERVVEADFFTYEPPAAPGVIYERAFLCALPREMRAKVARRWEHLLAPGTLLAGYFFFDDAPKGPPFGISREELEGLLGAGFECIEDAAVPDSIPVFAGRERWMVWRRR